MKKNEHSALEIAEIFTKGILVGSTLERTRIRRLLKPVLARMESMFPDGDYLEGTLMIKAIDAATRAPKRSK